MKNFRQSMAAFTLIEAMTLLFIFSLMALTFYSLFGLGTKYILESKNRLEATALASEKMETIRNLAYGDIGVMGGIPQGRLPENETVTRSHHAFLVHIFVQYMDDAFDGVAPADVLPNDYKRVKVTVSWQNDDESQREVSLVSRFVPPGLETSAGGGVLSINAVNSQGEGLGQVALRLVNEALSPRVDFSSKTDATGNLTLPAAAPSVLGYQITATKDGYESITTVDPTTLGYVPTDAHASVVEGAVNTKTIIMDKLADIQVISQNISGESLANESFSLAGGRIIGTKTDGTKVYNFSETAQTDSDGKKTFLQISPGAFTFRHEDSPSGYTWVRTRPNLAVIPVPPGEAKTIYSQFVANDTDALKVTVTKEGENVPVAGATVELTGDNDFKQTTTTDEEGIAFFPSGETPTLTAGNFQVKVQADGLADYTDSVDINKLTNKGVILKAQ